VRDWLETIGLGQYADAFEANDIDTDLLIRLDDQLLKDIGVASAGHRLRLRDAIAKLAPTSVTQPNAASAATPAAVPATSAERRQLTVMFCDLVGSGPSSKAGCCARRTGITRSPARCRRWRSRPRCTTR
jgi:hypothetical protein